MQKRGLEDIKQVKRSCCPSCSCCPRCSCGLCWQACLGFCCFHCSQETIEEVEDISSPRNYCGKRKAPLPSLDKELVDLGDEETLCSSCSLCCRKRKKIKRELACCHEPKKIDVGSDELDPTIIFQKKKASQDHDQVPYRREDDLTLLNYLEAGWPMQEELQPESKCFPFLCSKQKKVDTKQKGKAACCTSPCGDKKKQVDLTDFTKIDNSLALVDAKKKGKENLACCKSPCGDRKKKVDVKDAKTVDHVIAVGGASSGTLVWDKPPPVTQQDLPKNPKDQPEATLTKKNSQIHDNVLFTQESALATHKPKNPLAGEPMHPPRGEGAPNPIGEGPLKSVGDQATKHVVEGAPKPGNLPQGWSWLMENSNSANIQTNVDKKPDIQTRFVHIIPEIVDKRFQLKSKDDMDISENKEKKFPRKLKYKEGEDYVETSLAQFAKPEIVDRRFTLKSKDDVFQKKEEKYQIIEEDVERLGVLHNKLGILQQQLLQKEQILVLEDKLKEQGHLQMRKEELALQREQLEILREKTRGQGHLGRNNYEEFALEERHHALLQEVRNEKEQLERKKEEISMEKKQLEMLQEEQHHRKKEEFIMEMKHLEMLRETQLEKKKEELITEKKHFEMLLETFCQKEKEDLNLEKLQMEVLQRQLSVEEKGKLKMKEQEMALEKENLEILREKLNCKERVQLEIKKEELSLQLEKTKEELAREKDQFKAMRESLDTREKGQIEKSKVQLAFEKQQLEELREKLNLKEKVELKKMKEMLDNVLMQIEMPSKNLSYKEKRFFERKNQELARDPFNCFSKSISNQEKDNSGRNKVEALFKDPLKSTKDSNGYKGGQISKDERKNSKFFSCLKDSPTTQTEATILENNEKHKARGARDCESFDVTKCAIGFNNSSSISNSCGMAFKKPLPLKMEKEKVAEELFEIENKRQGVNLELVTMPGKGQYEAIEKRHKGKGHIVHDLDKQEKSVDCFKKMKEGAHKISSKKDYCVGQSTKKFDDEKKRPRAILEYDGHENLSKPLGLEATPKNLESLKEGDGDHNKEQQETIHANNLASQHGKKFDLGPEQARFQMTCTRAKQPLSYNFDPPKRRSDLEPERKKAKRSDNIYFVPPNIFPPCAGTKLDCPGRAMLSSFNIKDKSLKCFTQHHGKTERVGEHAKIDSKDSNEEERSKAKIIKGKIEAKFPGKSKIKARFRYRGSLDERAQAKLLGKLKELELQDLRAKLAEKKNLLEKLDRAATSTSKHQKSP